MPAYLDTIIAAHRRTAASDERDLDAMVARAAVQGSVRPFTDAVRSAAATEGMAVIAEIKRRSPSKGDIDRGLDPAELAAAYERGGATCLSVLTDTEFFAGSPDDLRAARGNCSMPVLRKDFTVSGLDICDARLMGADAVLLIVAALDDGELGVLLGIARACSLTALVEVHDTPELDRALRAGAEVIGVNQRDLATFEVDHDRALAMGAQMPPGVVRVAESGIRDVEDVRRLRDAGYQAVLVGETLVRADDRQAAVAGLREGIR